MISIPRINARRQALRAKFDSEKHKPPTRKQIQAWLEPIRRAFRQIKSGEVDAVRGYAITRIKPTDDDYARIDHCINGFTAMLDRVCPEIDAQPLKSVSKKLANGVLLTVQEIDACFAVLNTCENALRKYTRAQLKDAATTEQINIELELKGLK